MRQAASQLLALRLVSHVLYTIETVADQDNAFRRLTRCEYAWTEPQHVQEDQLPCSAVKEPLIVCRCSDCVDLSSQSARELIQTACADYESSNLAGFMNEIFQIVPITITHLLDDYFASIHVWLPIVDEGQLRSRLSSWPQSSDSRLAIL